MSRYQFYLLPLLAAVMFFLTGSMEQTAAPLLSIPGAGPATAIRPWEGETRPLPSELNGLTAVALIDKAIASLVADKIAALNMNFHQQVALDDIVFELEGCFVTGPEQHVRYESCVKIGTDVSKTLVTCDGVTITEVEELPGKPRQTNSTNLPTVQQTGDDPATVAAARQTLLQSKTFSGLAPLLTALKAGFREPTVRVVRVQGQDLLEVKGKWAAQENGADTVPDESRLRTDLQECRIYFDSVSLWPRCVEWWGGTKAAGNQVLVQTTYDRVIPNEPQPTEQPARELP